MSAVTDNKSHIAEAEPWRCSDLTSMALRAARWPLSMVTVLNHVIEPDVVATSACAYTLTDYPAVQSAIAVADAFTRGFAIPAFFLISGYLFVNGLQQLTAAIYRDKLRRRVNTLLVPYLLWNAIALIVAIALTLPPLADYLPGRADYYYSVKSCIWGFVGIKPGNYWPHDGSLWFVRDLMIAVALMPLGYRLLRRCGALMMAVLALFWLWAYTYVPNSYAGFISPALMFFYGGAYLNMRRVDIGSLSRRALPYAAVAYVALAALCMALADGYPRLTAMVHNINLVVFIVLAIGLSAWAVSRFTFRHLKFWASVSFFVYAAHVIIFYFYKPLVFSIIAPHTDVEVLLTLIAVYVSIGALLPLLYAALRRLCPAALAVLTGGRR